MTRLVCALLLLAVATASAADSRVIGGFPTSAEKYPSVLQIERPTLGIWRQFCGGVILTSRWSLSTASCFVGPAFISGRRRVRAGSSVRNTGGQVSGVVRVLKHPSWDEGLNYDGDIALILLETPLQYSEVVQQARILEQGAFVPDNYPSSQVGWGATFNEPFPEVFSPELRELPVVTVNNARCAATYAEAGFPRTVTSNMICTAAQGEAGACLGDRGGPLYAGDIVIGLVSWGRGCANEYPTVHTTLPSYTNWILANAV